MQRNLFASPSRQGGVVLLGLLVAAVAMAQPAPYAVEVSAERDWVLSARRLPLAGLVTSEFGEVLDTPLTWQSTNPDVAEVDASGVVLGKRPGQCDIVASVEGLSGIFTVWVHPGAIEIRPHEIDVNAGATAAVVARVRDAGGKEIAGLAIEWRSSRPTVASVDGSGMVRGLAPGTATITARLRLSDDHPGFSAQAPVRVGERLDFRVDPLVSSASASMAALGAVGEISFSRDGRYAAYLGVMSNGGQGLFLEDGSRRRLLAWAGRHIEAVGAAPHWFTSVSVNSAGDVAAHGWFLPPRQVELILVFRAGQTAPEVMQLPPGYCCLNSLQRGALSESGEVVFSAVQGPQRQLFRLGRNGALERVMNPNPPELAGFSPDSASFTRAGRIIFGVAGPGRNGAYHWDGKTARKILFTGESIAGKRVDWFNPPFETEDGDIYFHGGGPDSNRLLRWSAGVWSDASPPNIGGGWTLLDAAADTLLYTGSDSSGRALYRQRRDGAPEMLLRRTDPPAPNDYKWILRGGLGASRSALVRIDTGASRVLRFDSGEPVSWIDTARPLPVETPHALLVDGMAASGHPADPVFRTSGGTAARLQAGVVVPLLSPGGLLPGGSTMGSLQNCSRSSGGDMVCTAGTDRGSGFYRIRNNTVSLIAQQGDSFPAAGINAVNDFNWVTAVNNRGQAAAQLNHEGRNSIVLFGDTPAQARRIATFGTNAPGGGTLSWPNGLAVDETGRVMLRASTTDGQENLFLWENDQLRRLWRSGERSPSGVAARYALARAAGNTFYAIFWNDSNQGEIAEFDGGQWRTRVRVGDALRFGASIGWLHNWRFEVNASGDLLFMPGMSDGIGVVVRKRDGRDLLVARLSERLASGEWLMRPHDIAFYDTGEVLFSASAAGVSTAPAVLFRAQPQ